MMIYNTKVKELEPLGKLDTPTEIYETVLLGKKTIYSEDWKETSLKKLNKAFGKEEKKFYSAEDTRNYLNWRINLICKAAIMTCNQNFLTGPARYFHNMLISYNPSNKEEKKIFNKFKFKKLTSSNENTVLIPNENLKSHLKGCWTEDKFKPYEDAFKDGFNYSWKYKCKELIKKLRAPQVNFDEKEANVYTRLQWVFEKLEEIEEEPDLMKELSEVLQNILKQFSPFRACMAIEPKRNRSKQTILIIDPVKSIQKVRSLLLDVSIDSALERYNLVKKLTCLEEIIFVPRSLNTYGRLDPIVCQKIRRESRKEMLRDFHRYNKRYTNLADFKRTASGSFTEAEEADMDTTSPENSYIKVSTIAFRSIKKKGDSPNSSSSESQPSPHREQEDADPHTSLPGFIDLKYELHERMSWLDLETEVSVKRKLSDPLNHLSPNEMRPVKQHRTSPRIRAQTCQGVNLSKSIAACPSNAFNYWQSLEEQSNLKGESQYMSRRKSSVISPKSSKLTKPRPKNTKEDSTYYSFPATEEGKGKEKISPKKSNSDTSTSEKERSGSEDSFKKFDEEN